MSISGSAAGHDAGDSQHASQLSGWPHSQFSRRRLALQFTGSGSEYFRIWIVNLLLCLVTVGLYWPFAKARRLRYFYANTVIDEQALAFHGDPWLMFRGFILMAVLSLAYGLAGKVSPALALLAFVVLCVVWPALWQTSLKFRMANTSWRGLRFGFVGSRAGAYKALLPIYLPTLLMVAVQLYFADQLQPVRGQRHEPGQAEFFVGLAMIVWTLLLPLGLASIKRYQHGGYLYAGRRSQIDLPTGRAYLIGLKTIGVMLLALLLVLGCVMLGAWLGGRLFGASIVLFGAGVVFAYLSFFAVVAPYFAARSQDLVWNATNADGLQFESNLSYRALAWLTLKNWLLTLLTLGLYRPFAAVNTARMRLEAVSVMADGDPMDLVTMHRAEFKDASGEAAGDFFGIDLGL
ncbi:YjgN family protein [Paucibacter sp. APW11]|uniref:YjgN family protein n=1 Tax=Roseateles aquae TaxID=3077235 RepID=A0ABU3PES5_9BURK|nr:YjgN family protein [Paucibacter sp. APW11]MDT9000860.1 YjgN family protein [Paucibacter sp. APW11]